MCVCPYKHQGFKHKKYDKEVDKTFFVKVKNIAEKPGLELCFSSYLIPTAFKRKSKIYSSYQLSIAMLSTQIFKQIDGIQMFAAYRRFISNLSKTKLTNISFHNKFTFKTKSP